MAEVGCDPPELAAELQAAFCEPVQPCGWALQPWATASSVAFVVPLIAGLLGARALGQRVLVALSVVAAGTGVSTAALHGLGTDWARHLDQASLQGVDGLMVALALRRATGRSWPVVLGAAGAWAATLVVLGAEDVHLARALYVVGFLPASALELTLLARDRVGPREIELRWLVASWVLFAGAGLAWAGASGGWWCDPEVSWHRPHALWHVLTALALACLAPYYGQFEALRVRGRTPGGR